MRTVPPADALEAPTKAGPTDVRNLKAQASSSDQRYADEYARGAADAHAGREPEPPFDDELAPSYQLGHSDARAQIAEREGSSSTGGSTRSAARSGSAGGRSATSTSTGATSSNPGAGILSRLTSGSTPLDSGAGLLLGAILYANVVNYLRGGLPAVKGWYAAKFLNRPYTGPLAGGSSAKTASTSSAAQQAAASTAGVPAGPPVGVPSVLSSTGGTAGTAGVSTQSASTYA